MLVNYLASADDLSTIEEGVRCTLSEKLLFIFPNRSLLNKVTVLSFDRKYLYIWTPFHLNSTVAGQKCSLTNYLLYKIPHTISIIRDMDKGWQEGIREEFIGSLAQLQFTPDNWMERPLISGSLLTPFITIHEEIRKQNPEDAYCTRESYLATIIHEFAHVYYHFHRLWWFSDKKGNLGYIHYAKLLFSQTTEKKGITEKIQIKLPVPQYFTEIFAFCAEYYAASRFWQIHVKNIHAANKARLTRLLPIEQKKNLDREDSILSWSNPHDIASILGIILMDKYPSTWPQRLLSKITF